MNDFKKKWMMGFLSVLHLTFSSMAHVASEEMAEAGQHFLESLKPEQRTQVSFDIANEERFNWQFVPQQRKGLALKDMTKFQRDAVRGLLDAALSQRGFIKATTIMSLESVLSDLENKNPEHDPGLYYISIFGVPEAKGTWGWRFEGHHLSLNVTILDGKQISTTPCFMGTYPAEVQDGPRKGLRVLGAEEDLGRQLLAALDEDQRKSAIIMAEAPKEIFTKNDRKISPLEPAGLSLLHMNREQSELLLKLVKEYVYRYREEIANDDWRKIQNAGIERIHFAWAGSAERGQGHYYRVQGPTFLLEYDNTQNDANHVHSVWRDFNGDFGEDLLGAYYQHSANTNGFPKDAVLSTKP